MAIVASDAVGEFYESRELEREPLAAVAGASGFC
jgi:hypothetical protein